MLRVDEELPDAAPREPAAPAPPNPPRRRPRGLRDALDEVDEAAAPGALPALEFGADDLGVMEFVAREPHFGVPPAEESVLAIVSVRRFENFVGDIVRRQNLLVPSKLMQDLKVHGLCGKHLRTDALPCALPLVATRLIVQRLSRVELPYLCVVATVITRGASGPGALDLAEAYAARADLSASSNNLEAAAAGNAATLSRAESDHLQAVQTVMLDLLLRPSYVQSYFLEVVSVAPGDERWGLDF